MFTEFIYPLVLLFGVFVAAISQVMLKKAAVKNHGSIIKEYLNPLVIGAYFLFSSSGASLPFFIFLLIKRSTRSSAINLIRSNNDFCFTFSSSVPFVNTFKLSIRL